TSSSHHTLLTRHLPIPPFLSFQRPGPLRDLHSFPTRRSSDLPAAPRAPTGSRRHRGTAAPMGGRAARAAAAGPRPGRAPRSSWGSEEHTSELQSLTHLVCRLLL